MEEKAIEVRHKYKLQWQRQARKSFRETHGYSLASSYGCGKMRHQILARDLNRCVSCGMTDIEHREKWGRPITIDHKDRNRKNNSPDNLQTLCLRCHGRKDQPPALRRSKIPDFRKQITSMRKTGKTYQSIAGELGVSIASIWKWCKRWEKE